jgi:hypothetical protein
MQDQGKPARPTLVLGSQGYSKALSAHIGGKPKCTFGFFVVKIFIPNENHGCHYP